MTRISIAFVLVGLATGLSHGQQVVVTPEETDEILANPGMGWETFHRTSTQDKSLPSWIPSTVHYARWGWRELEPQPGKIDYAFLDGVLNESREAGQTLAFRVMCCSTSPRQPYRSERARPHHIKTPRLALDGQDSQSTTAGFGIRASAVRNQQ